MNNIAVLGPQNTYTDMATKVFLERQQLDMNLIHYPTISKTFSSIGSECLYGVIPIENTLDGYVQVSLDLLANSDLQIIYEVVLPIDFAFVANCGDISDLKKVYVQFKTENQCLNFLEQLEGVDLVTTPSNGASFEAVMEGRVYEGAIIPVHMLEEEKDFLLRIDHVADSIENETRFLILGKVDDENKDTNHQWRTSLLVQYDDDKPGLLGDILTTFSRSGINLKSIMSRPKKSRMGHYIFFIDIEGCYKRNTHVQEAVALILAHYDVKVLGSYYRVN